MDYTIYHNNRCRKSREALQYLTENNIPHKIVHYLETPLNAEELKAILNALGCHADRLCASQLASEIFLHLTERFRLHELNFYNKAHLLQCPSHGSSNCLRSIARGA